MIPREMTTWTVDRDRDDERVPEWIWARSAEEAMDAVEEEWRRTLHGLAREFPDAPALYPGPGRVEIEVFDPETYGDGSGPIAERTCLIDAPSGPLAEA